MTPEQFEQRKIELYDAAFNKMEPELLREFGEEIREAILVTAFAEALEQEVRRDPEFKAAYCQEAAKRAINEWDQDHRPTGAYREDGIIPLSETIRKFMNVATRADLLAWYQVETDPRNLTYIETRLAAWQPDHATLEDLERSLNPPISP
jgi:hypothetical protein